MTGTKRAGRRVKKKVNFIADAEVAGPGLPRVPCSRTARENPPHAPDHFHNDRRLSKRAQTFGALMQDATSATRLVGVFRHDVLVTSLEDRIQFQNLSNLLIWKVVG